MKLYRHVKSGGVYVVLSERAVLEESLTPCVIYQRVNDERIWIRPQSEFFDGRFEKYNIPAVMG